jgi:hypothetical protein
MHHLRTYLMTPENLELIKKDNPTGSYGIYGVYSRYVAGIYNCFSGAKGGFSEFFCCCPRDVYNPFDGAGFNGSGYQESFSIPGKEEWLPTVWGEKVREGIDDTRYVRMLADLIEKGRAKGVNVADGEKAMDEIKAMVDPDGTSMQKYGEPDAAVYDKVRWKIAREIMRLIKEVGSK